MSVPRAALLWHRDHPSAGKVCAGKRIGVCRYLLGSARGDHIAAVYACAGTNIYDIIRPAHHILVMLNNYHRVAEVAQLLERGYQQVVVALVQSYARLVKHVKHADKGGAYLRCKADALCLAAREGPRAA